ncbi:MAG: DUF3108 domain-containing protein [Bacteroidales bacterium]|nr:DUF3108 domain-containing protein [Bacteroidales bacterium]
MRLLLPLITVFVAAVALAGDSDPATSAALSADHPALQPYRAVYTARYNRMPIEAHRRLRVDGDGFTLVTEARNLLGRIHEEESFHLDNQGGLIPGDYVYDRSILGTSRKETTAVNAAAGTSVSHRKGEETVLDFHPGQLGPLSYQIAMAADLAARDLDGDATRLSYTVIHRGRLREYTYEVLNQSVDLDTPLGTLSTIKVERVRENDDRETVLWLAPELNYLPVQLMQVEDGETYEMTIKSFTLEP